MSELIHNESQNCCSSSFKGFSPSFKRRTFLVSAGTVTAGLAARPVLANEKRKNYADLVKGHPALIGYWRFDGKLTDELGKQPAVEGPANLEFAKGAVEGQALHLTPGLHVGVPALKTVERGAETLELFFKLNALPDEEYDPVIVSWASEEVERFILGVKHDLSGLIWKQGYAAHHVTSIKLPTGKPVELGRWYHLTIMSEQYDLRIYVNGYECALTGGAMHISRRYKEKVAPMTFGSVARKDSRAANIEIDEFAHYGEGLSLEEAREHLVAGGWSKQLEQYGREVESYQGKLKKVREKKRASIMNDPALVARGESTVYQDENLSAVSFMVGGIGAGAIQYNGTAKPAIWQIACNHDQTKISDSFMAIRAQVDGGQPVVRALQTEAVGPFAAMKNLKFIGEYPIARYQFEEPALPVEVELELLNPFTPMDLKSSGIPCIVSTVKVTNTSSVPVTVDVLAAQKNIVGYTTGATGSKPAYGQNRNRLLRKEDATLLHMTKDGEGQGAGMDMVLMTRAAGATGLAKWDSQQTLHDALSKTGELSGADTTEPSPAEQTLNGALSAPLELAPGQSESVTYVLTWHMPKAVQGDAETWRHKGNMYTNWWPNAMAVADDLRNDLDDLVERTYRFHDSLYASDMPHWLLDRLSSQLATLRSQTCWWAADGYFGVYEGVGGSQGCCSGNCAHVWHYAQSHARLFPELGRRMREQDFDNQKKDGRLPFRHSHPNSRATDGQFGTILNTYREYQCSKDDIWLKEQWSNLELAMKWAMEQWDPDQDGYMEGRQDNTLDGHIYGCSSWLGTMYLSTLEAMARMAEINGKSQLAASYRKVRASGQKLQNERLWNGEYYIQEAGKQRSGDYLDGCHIDQLLGEWWGEQVGVDRNYPKDRSKKAMKALFKYNFHADFHGQSMRPRQFVAVEDGGTKMITWPKNNRPIPCMDYGDEIMTGFEYAAAATMVQNGLLREGLTMVKANHDRYDGRKRTENISKLGVWGYTGNPFGDDECGKFYGRALSIWSMLLVMQGFEYDGPAGRIGFRPRWKPEDHTSFFTAAEGYGLFTQKVDNRTLQASLELREGKLRLTEVVLAFPGKRKPVSVVVTSGGDKVGSRFLAKDGDLSIELKIPQMLEGGQRLDIRVT